MGIRVGDKANRVLKLLLGLRNPRVASALAVYGFTEQDMQEGWTLLQALGASRLGVLPIQARDGRTVQQLDEWENQWFPIISATLARRYPKVHERLFLNLSQTEGPEVTVGVRTLLDRIQKLSEGAPEYGPDAQAARQLLETRGVTAVVIGQAEALLQSLARVAEPAEPISVEEQQAQLVKAEDALWAWYLEWSQVARVAITNRGLLRQLGFLANKPNGAGGEDDDDGEEEVTPPAVVTPPVGGPSLGTE
jgi:hypothetical protein